MIYFSSLYFHFRSNIMIQTYNQSTMNEIVKEKASYLIQDDEYLYLYKYMSFDENLYVLDTFKNTKFKYTLPEKFNDPYDCLFKVEMNFKGFTKKNFENASGIKIDDQLWLAKKESYKDAFIQIYKEKFCKTFRDRIAVTCFSADPTNILMWSHYANHHSGFLIECKIPKFSSNCKIKSPNPVIYSNEYPLVNLNWNQPNTQNSSVDTNIDLLANTVLTKATCWAYENEYRLIDRVDENEKDTVILRSFNPLFISNVIVGSKIKPENLEKLTASINLYNNTHNLNLKIYKSVIMENLYELNVLNHPLLYKK